MLTNDKVFFLRYIEETEKYEPVGACDAWVFCKDGILGSAKGNENADVVHIRIRKEDVASVKKGDYVFVGNTKNTPNIEDCRKVTRVSDNKFGTVPHWHVEVEG